MNSDHILPKLQPSKFPDGVEHSAPPRIKILIVDDLKENLVALEAFLRRDDIEIFQANSGTDALELLMTNEFALSILDVNMPVMSGFELAEFMRGTNKTKNVPIIFVTATATDRNFTFNGYESGAVDFLIKPLDTHTVKSKVNVFIELYRYQREQHELLVQLTKTQAELEQAVRIRDEFISTLSHELRTPLTAILLWTQVIQRQKFDPDKLKHGIKMIEQSADMQGQLIDDLLDITRIRSGKLLLNLTIVNPAESVNLCIETVCPMAEKRQIVIKSEIIINSEKAWCDSERLQQIIWNLITNAIKFSLDGGVIRVRVESVVEQGDPFVSIKVIDQGKGISPEFLPKLFERFSQADSSSARNHGGLGLGLAIVRDLVLLHNGRVRAESEGLGKGSTFTVLLPIKAKIAEIKDEQTSIVKNKTKEEAVTAILVGLCLMIVEDDLKTLEVTCEILQSFGAKTIPCSSVAEALEVFEKVKPDVLISDISMPGEDGFSLIRKIRKLGPDRKGDVPSLALSALATEGDVKKILAAGFNSHMAKPFNMLHFGRVISELANLKRG